MQLSYGSAEEHFIGEEQKDLFIILLLLPHTRRPFVESHISPFLRLGR